MTRCIARILLAAAALAAVPASAVAEAPGTTSLLSRPSGLGAMPGGQVNESYAGPRFATSVDGCRTVFVSESDGLSAADDDRFQNVFVRDACQDKTILVSRANGANGAAANAGSSFPTISADGKVVAFVTHASNLAAVDGTEMNLYVRRLDTDTTVLATPAASGGGGANDWVGWPSLNGDGAMVAFSSLASNLVAGDTNGNRDVFVRTLTGTPETRLVSRPHVSTTALGNSWADRPSIDHRGHSVAFDSASSNLVSGDSNGQTDVFVRSLTYGYTTLVSRIDGYDGTPGNGSSMYASMSGDGSKVAFSTAASNIVPGANTARDVVVREFDGDPVNEVATQGDASATFPALDGDGSHVAFTQGSRVVLRDLGADATRLVSRGNGDAGAIPPAGGWADQASVDGNASKVTYSTSDDDLGTPGLYDNDFAQVLQRDMATETNALVSRPAGSGTAPFGGNGDNQSESTDRALSANGRYVAFTSAANGLVAGDDDRVTNVYRRDTKTGETVLVSRASGAAGAPGDGDSSEAAISADGRRVAFRSRASNLGGGALAQVYVRDVEAGTTTLVSRAAGASGAVGDAGSWDAAISADGTHVAFTTDAKNLGGSPATRAVYVRDLAANTLEIVNRADGANGAVTSTWASDPALDADGSRVAFETGASNLDPADTWGDIDVYVRDLDAGTTTLASGGDAGQLGNGNAVEASLDADGDTVAFSARDYKHEDEQVYVQRLATPRPPVVLASRGGDGQPLGGGSWAPSLSADGDRVAFASWDGTNDVFVRDLAAGTTTLLSRASGDGPAGDGDSEHPSISGNGHCVAFTSSARNLDGAYAGDFTQVWRRAVDAECPLPDPKPVGGGEERPTGEDVFVPAEQRPGSGGDRGPGGQQGPDGTAAKPRIVLAPGTRLRRTAKGRVLSLALQCAPGARCTGTVRLALGRVKLGRALVALAGGRRGTVKVKVGAAARRALAKGRGKKVTITITLAGGAKTIARVPFR